MIIMMIVRGRATELGGYRRASTAVFLPSLVDFAKLEGITRRRFHRRGIWIGNFQRKAALADLPRVDEVELADLALLGTNRLVMPVVPRLKVEGVIDSLVPEAESFAFFGNRDDLFCVG